MKICIGQINTTPGDFAGNKAKVIAGIDAAVEGGADILVFPELTIPGYLSQDLIYHPAYIETNLAIVEEVAQYANTAMPLLKVVVGFIERNSGAGKPFFNSAAVLSGGEIIATYRKELLPFYDVFDELRYFQPDSGLTLFEHDGNKVGIAICEDLWNDKGSDDYNYAENPMERYRREGVDVILSLNSSPYVHDKVWQRLRTIGPGTDNGLKLVYVNQVGGQDELVFDGHSFVLDDGELVYLASSVFSDSFDIVDIGQRLPPIVPKVTELTSRGSIGQLRASLFDLLVLCLRDYVLKSGFEELVLASSGGVDSAVVCLIACHAVGPDKVHAIRMPSIYSSGHSRDDAVLLHKNLGCWDYEVPIEHQSVVDQLNSKLERYNEDDSNLITRQNQRSGYNFVADENMQARLRDLYVMHFSNAWGAMPLSTGNKTESACGYYTHFDMNFSFAPIKDLYKYEVNALARDNPKIPENIWQKPPSAELAPGQIDEKSLLPYAVLDPMVKAYVEDYVSSFAGFQKWVHDSVTAGEQITGDPEFLNTWISGDTAEIDHRRIISLVGKMEYKRRQTCPGTKVSKVAFGIGRRIPIVEKWS